MDARRAYEAELLGTFARIAGRRAPAISDTDVQSERQLFQFVLDHVQALKVACENFNKAASVNPKIDWQAIADYLSDEIPTPDDFDERMSEARRNY